MAANQNREFDFILLGPTGYTGRLCAEYVVKNLPTDLKWGIAGRSAQKLEAVASELKKINQDRVQPEIFPLQLNEAELKPLVSKARLVINCVGPYHLYSTPVVAACAHHGTHYLDVTGEVPWVKQMIAKYHDVAKANKCLIIPCNGVESAPADVLTWALVNLIRQQLQVGTKELVLSLHDMKSAGPSGGTLATVLTTLETVKVKDLMKSSGPFSIAAVPPSEKLGSRSLFEKIFGIRTVPDLGTLTTSIAASVDVPVVHRSSSLAPGFYGSRFRLWELMKARNAFTGILTHFAIAIGFFAIMFSPVRMLLQRYIFQPGQGPERNEASKHDYVEYRGIATADEVTTNGRPAKRAYGKLTFEGDMYWLTGLLLAEAAMVILKNEKELVEKNNGGLLTPSTLGQEYVDRLNQAGVSIETNMLE
ncbi:hypothetical protein FQN54_007942 [Arachnomyces sp. PD_36]|nr:hypothetical protein FQN54_007942 [Arachnomyces sp. PD_36]